MLIKIFRQLTIFIVYLPASLVLFLLNIRVIALTNPGRIGHLCIEPDCFIKERLLGMQSRFKALFLIPANVAANEVVLDLWRQKVTVLTSPGLCKLISPVRRFRWSSYSIEKYVVAIESTATGAGILARWADRPPILELDQGLSEKGFEALERLGIPKHAWFVCVHSREGHYSPTDEHLHSYRNSSIQNYGLAIREITERGGWCIRVGEPTPISLPISEGVIDYANSMEKNEWMDVFLAANCRFFLGNSSGLFFLATIFGKRSALANMAPMSCALPLAPGDLGIPKILRSVASGEPLTFRQIFDSPIANFRFTWQYEEAGIVVEENSPDDIRDLAVEMLNRLTNEERYDTVDEQLQKRFQSLFRKGHYSFGAESRIGRCFLRKHASLF